MTTYRLAREEDVAAILEISNEAAATTTANFAIEPETLERWLADFCRERGRYPWFVALDERVVGFARATPWKGRCAYAFSVEISVYVRPEARRRGIARGLYRRLLETLRAQGYRTALAGITQPNEASVRLHEELGMRRVALLERVGWKFDRWHDVGYWQLDLHPGEDPPGAIRPVSAVVSMDDGAAPTG